MSLSRRWVAVALAAFAALGLAPSSASAEPASERRETFSVYGRADFYSEWRTCPGGWLGRTQYNVTGGYDRDVVNGATTNESRWLRVGFIDQCTGERWLARTTDGVKVAWTDKLTMVSLSGSVVTPGGAPVDVNVVWNGVGDVRVDRGNNSWAGHVGMWTYEQRDASATATVSVSGSTVVDGSTTAAWVEKDSGLYIDVR